MSRKSIFYIAFFVGLFLVFYFVLTKIIPGFTEKELPVLSDVQPFSFTNQENKTITNKDVAGKVYVAEYFFTTCKGICPKMNTNLKKIYEMYKDQPDFLILSHTVDPETDSVARMKHYADSLGINPAKWWFLTGSKEGLYKAARVSYLLDDPKNNLINPAEQFIHTQFFSLVDRNGQVRKIYDGLKKEDIEEMKSDINSLLKETVKYSRAAKPFSSNNFN
ncbi:MAG TPA: SCO family protein [Puia sp.]|nr:SCO family protein [Puia sp.]